MSWLFSASSPTLSQWIRGVWVGALSLAAASCLGVLELDSYDTASEQLCSLYDRCYGPEAFIGCRRHVSGQLESASAEQRDDFLRLFGDCLDDCQHASDCLDQPFFCKPLRETCGASGQCCGFGAGTSTCFEQSCCLVKDAPCTRDVDCCAGKCTGGKCNAAVMPMCSAIGVACNANTDCCSNICTGGVCANACAARGASCVNNVDCCSNKCSNGVCRKQGCLASGELCLSDVDCCTDTCDKGRGICGNAGCFSDGTPCSKDGDCCSGLVCNPADHRCASLSCKKYGDGCAQDADCCGLYCNGSCQCAQVGTACTQAEAYKCCTGVCENSLCVDCTPPNTACTDNAQCCSGTCHNGSCCNTGCAHSLCNVGGALSTKDCSPQNVGAAAASCVSTICAQDPACCCNSWNQGCVDKVSSVCKLVCP